MNKFVLVSALLLLLLIHISTSPHTLQAHARFVRTPGAKLRVCSFYSGTIQDLGFVFAFHLGRLAIQEKLVAMYPDIEIESVYEATLFTDKSRNRTQNIIDYVRSGCHVIMSHANECFLDYNYTDISYWAAQTYRNVSFIIGGDSNKPLTWSEPNMIFLSYDMVSAFYIAGAAAAHEAVDCIGFFASFEDRVGINVNAFIRGAHSVKPTLPIHVSTTGSWYWPAGERRIAEILLNRSCNVIAHNTDVHEVDQLMSEQNQIGRARRYFSVAIHSNLQRYIGDSVLTSVVEQWDAILVPWLSQVIEKGAVQQYPAPKYYGMVGGYVINAELSALAKPTTVAAVKSFGVLPEDSIFCGTIKLRDGRSYTSPSPGACMNITERRLFLTAYLDDPYVHYHPMFVLETECPPGTWYSYSKSGNITLTCTPCPVNTYSEDAGSATCRPCMDGTEAASIGSANCTLIPLGVDVAIIISIVLSLVATLIAVLAGALVFRIRSMNRYAPRDLPMTFVFTDIEGSTKLWQTCSESMTAALDIHHDVIRKQIKEYQGYEVKTVGDAFMIACGTPLDAALLATAIQQALQDTTWPEKMRLTEGCGEGPPDVWNGLRVRIGVHYGQSVAPQFDAIHQRYDYYGHDVNVAARVEAEAMGGQILMSEDIADALAKEPDYRILFPDGHVLARENVELKGVDGVKTLYMLITPGLEERHFNNVNRPAHGAESDTCTQSEQHFDGCSAMSSNAERAALLRPVRTMLSLCPKEHYNSVVSMVAEGCGARPQLPVARKLVVVMSRIVEAMRDSVGAGSPVAAGGSPGAGNMRSAASFSLGVSQNNSNKNSASDKHSSQSYLVGASEDGRSGAVEIV
eukprot:PhM_4_TR3018/c4_g3_i18/m.89626